MVYGTIIQKGEEAYTYLKKLFDSINNMQMNYKWLISYPECYPLDKDIQKLLNNTYCILTGKELTELVTKEDFQWIWGTFSAFDPSTPDTEILKYKLPENDMYPGFWKNPLTMQHPLSKIEIVAFDSSYTLIFTKDFTLPEKFKEYYPKAEDLESVNLNMESTVSVRVISNEQRKNELSERLKTFCKENGLEFKILQDEPYWKIETLFEMSIELYPAPVWNYANWSDAYKFIFRQDFTIEWDDDEDIVMYHYPAYDDLYSYFVIFRIPSKCFSPKPSKTVRH